MRVKLAILVLLVLVFGVIGFQYYSGKSTETFAIDQEQFVKAYVELATLAESMPIGTPEYDREKERVLGEIGLQPAQVEEALAMYNQRPELWRPVWERIQQELEKRGNAVGEGAMDTTGSMHTP
jgi:hypothetical protein